MMKTVRFVMALHNHQPVGNFEDVVAKACRMAYHPFLDVAEEFPGIRLTLHYSGPLFEPNVTAQRDWFVEHLKP